MNILVIGNGFDLAHGLPTSYSDFLGFIKYFKTFHDSSVIDINTCKTAKNFKKLSESVQEYLLKDNVRDKTNDLVNELYNISSNNIWIKHLTKCAEGNRLKGMNWIDFESEISKVIKGLEYYRDCLKEKIRKGNEVCTPEDKTLFDIGYNFLNENKKSFDSSFRIEGFYDYGAKEIINKLNDELNNLIRCLEIYLEDVVGKINIEKKLPDIEDKQLDKLISFNYTDTFKKIYDKDDRVETDYIHGSLDISKNIEKNNMVLGIDEYLQGNKKREELDFIQFKKYFQRIYKKTGCKYKKWLENIKPIQAQMYPNGMDRNSNSGYVNNVYIYGHSLDITDKDILRELILFPNTQVNIFYYNKDDYAQKIRNMVALIDQDELIDRVYGENPKIVFREIKK